MRSRNRLVSQIEREREYLASLEVGSDEYVKSQERLMKMEQMLEERKDRIAKNVLDGVKTASGIALPLIGLVWITAAEKEITFVGALREYTKYFLPKK